MEILQCTNTLRQRCVPGPYLESKFQWIADQVNKRLGQTVTSRALYRVRKTWANSASQIGAYTNLDNAKRACDSAGKSYYVFDECGNTVYPSTGYKVKVMVDALNIRSGPGIQYKINGCIQDCGVYTIVEEDANGEWGKLKSGQGWICLSYTQKI